MKEAYGDPPYLVPGLFLKVYAVVMLLVLIVGVGANLIGKALSTVDLVGLLVTSPILSYLVHLWMAPARRGQDRGPTV